MIAVTWRHEFFQGFRDDDSSVRLVQLQQNANDARSGAHRSIQHVHIIGLK